MRSIPNMIVVRWTTFSYPVIYRVKMITIFQRLKIACIVRFSMFECKYTFNMHFIGLSWVYTQLLVCLFAGATVAVESICICAHKIVYWAPKIFLGSPKITTMMLICWREHNNTMNKTKNGRTFYYNQLAMANKLRFPNHSNMLTQMFLCLWLIRRVKGQCTTKSAFMRKPAFLLASSRHVFACSGS